MQKTWRRFLRNEQRRLRDALLISVFEKTKGFFCFSFNNRAQKVSLSVFAYVFNSKMTRKPAEKKYRVLTFYLIGDHMQKFSSFTRKKKT